MNTSRESRLLTLAEVAAELRISMSTAYRMAQSGELPALKVGRQIRFDRDELRAWLYGDGTEVR